MDNAFCWRKDKPCKESVYVVDGQAAKIDNCNPVANSIFEYIMTKNVDGEGIRVLKTVSSYPYFIYNHLTRVMQISQSLKKE